MAEREELTSEAAVRLIKCRLRCFIYDQVSDGETWREALLAFVRNVEGDILQEWHRVLALWHPEDRDRLLAVIREALGVAIQHSHVLDDIDEKVPGFIEEYAKSFQPESLLPAVTP